MRPNGLMFEGVEVGADPTPKMGMTLQGKTWVETGMQSSRSGGLLGWQVKVLVQTGDDERERAGVVVTVWSANAPKIKDRDVVRFPELDIRGSGEDRLRLTALEVQVVRDDKWVAA